MKQFINYLVLLCIVIATHIQPLHAAVGDTFEVDGLYFQEVNPGSGQVQVVASPKGEDDYSGSITIPNSVTYKGKQLIVRIIAEKAFENTKKLISIELPNTLAEIGRDAFRNSDLSILTFPNSPLLTKISNSAFIDSNLTTVIIPANFKTYIGYELFSSCLDLKSFIVDPSNTTYSSLEGVLYNKAQSKLILYPCKKSETTFTIPEKVTEIAPNAFAEAKVKVLTIPDNVTTLGKYSFYDCCDLEKVTIGKGITYIPDSAFYCSGELMTVTINGDVTEFGKGAFLYADLIRINIPESVKKINANAFGLTSLNQIHLPRNLEEIGFCAFESTPITSLTIRGGVKLGTGCFNACYKLSNISILEGTTDLPTACFAGTAISSIHLPASLKTIGEQAFYGCDNLKEVSLSSDNPNFLVENNILYSKDKKRLIIFPIGRQEINDFNVPEGVEIIGTGAFGYASYLNKITLPQSVDSIAPAAFYASALTEIKIPEKVTTIPRFAFQGCINLIKVELPEDIHTIGESAFRYCENLSDFSLPKKLLVIGPYAFNQALLVGEKFHLPENVKSIGEHAFDYSGISGSNIVIPPSLTDWGNDSFLKAGHHEKVTIMSSCPTPEYAFALNTGIKEVYIGASVKKIGNNLFDTYSELAAIEKVTLEEGIEEIGKYCFPGLYEEFILPNSVRKVGTYLSNSPNLKYLELGSGLEEMGFIGEGTNLQKIVSKAGIPPFVKSPHDDFGGLVPTEVYSKATLYVPSESIEDYKQAPYWNRFVNIKSTDLLGVEGVQPDTDNVTVTANGREINIEGAYGNVSVTDMSGQTVYSGPATTVSVAQGGVYIVRAAGRSFKIMVK